MTIEPTVTVTKIKGGVAAKAVEIGLAGHGRDQERALASLQSMVRTWASCLLAAGELERSLVRLGIATRSDTEELRVDTTARRITA